MALGHHARKDRRIVESGHDNVVDELRQAASHRRAQAIVGPGGHADRIPLCFLLGHGRESFLIYALGVTAARSNGQPTQNAGKMRVSAEMRT